MITGELKNKIDGLWEIFWTGGLTNPLDVIEQITYLMSAGLFWYAADGELAHRTTDTETARTTAGRGLYNPKGLQGSLPRDAGGAPPRRNLVPLCTRCDFTLHTLHTQPSTHPHPTHIPCTRSPT